MSLWHHANGTEIRWYEQLGSSNDVARDWALGDGSARGLVWAERQTAGRGRRGNAWLCPAGEGLAISYWLRPPFPRKDWSLLALVAAVAIADVLTEDYQVDAGIKWPNDIWVDGKKIAGILVEIVDDIVIVGMGINVNVSSFPESLSQTSTSIFLQTGLPSDRRVFIEKMISQMEIVMDTLSDGGLALIEQVRMRCVLRGRKVKLKTQQVDRCVEVIGIGDRGELWVMEEGRAEALWHADEIRPLL